MRIFFILAACFVSFAISAPSHAQKALSTSEKNQVEKMIADYLMENPEALRAALENMQVHYANLEEERKKQALRQSAEELFRSKTDFTMGPDDAPITIVEFFDYNCGYCKRAFEPLMQTLQENTDVRLVFKELPILSESSQEAAEIALAIGDRMKFLTFHTKLMTHKGAINSVFIDRTLEELDLSPAAIRKAAKSRDIAETLDNTQRLAAQLGISGTPAFIVNDELLPGALDKQQFDELIEGIRKEMKNNKG